MTKKLKTFPRPKILYSPLIAALITLSLLSIHLHINGALASPAKNEKSPNPQNPTVLESFAVSEFNGDLRNLSASKKSQTVDPLLPRPLKYVPGTEPKGASSTIANWVDQVAQNSFGAGLMPGPTSSFNGIRLSYTSIGGNGWPPDTNGDIGLNHYIQSVNTAFAIYDKSSGTEVVSPTHFNSLFSGTGTMCDNNNHGDPVVVYDRFEDRWVLTDFAFSSNNGPFYECVAVSKSNDPVSGGWWLYAILVPDDVYGNPQLNDYPKIGVWRDEYFLTFNMFSSTIFGYDFNGVQVWALQKAPMLVGNPLQGIYAVLEESSGYASLLPAHALDLPQASEPGLMASLQPPNEFLIWEFKPDWATPALSTFNGPQILTVSDFAIAASVPQKNSTALLDSLSYRPMMQLIYRATGGIQSLWMSHTVANEGIAGMRWYEVRNPSNTPTLYQQGTYQPDNLHRWMGSLAVDQDGNMALGYSVSSTDIYPEMRYSGRQNGETPGTLPQSEQTIIQGSGSQLETTRWGDYSAMSVDPVDDCTFWYTNQYYPTSSSLDIWYTRIASFKFPSCGSAKGTLQGKVRNAVSGEPISGVQVKAASASQNLTILTDESGDFSFNPMVGSFSLTAGPLLPAYPISVTVNSLSVTNGSITTQNFSLTPVPNLVEERQIIDDNVAEGNNNGYAEPGEKDLLYYPVLENNGAATSTNITAQITSLTPGVTVSANQSSYPDIAVGITETNTTPYVFSIEKGSVSCGGQINFRQTITDSINVYQNDLTLNASVPLPTQVSLHDDAESGEGGWPSGGTQNTWGITDEEYHNPTHSWADSPGDHYANNTNSYIRSPTINLTNKSRLKLSVWVKFNLEAGYDFVYVDYSLNGGNTWSDTSQALMTFNGFQNAWKQYTVDVPVLENQRYAAIRFRLVSDAGVYADGIYLDDILMTYQPYTCFYGTYPSAYLPFVFTQ